ncbi:hypothetical protein NWH84_004405 [Salmonella enterica]|nr:hypothetical protein [Salmonella enterica]EJS8566909.1 hypothetical protein [Salmonella enterica]EJS8571763.1 hypothetical protein [Salmonella enterica]
MDLDAIVYSANQMMGEALRHIFKAERSIRVEFSTNQDTLIEKALELRPECIILDISPRDSVSLIYMIRIHFPAVPVIFIQKYFLFSDRIISEYFGHIFLYEYDAVLCAYPDFTPLALFRQEMFSGTHCSGGVFLHNRYSGMTDMSLRQHINNYLRHRLAELVTSDRIRDVIMNWLVCGLSVAETGKCAQISDKVVYLYRRQVMSIMGIRKFSRDFIRSLKI